MAPQTAPRTPKKPETRHLRAAVTAKNDAPKRPAPKPDPAQKPVFSDWAMI